MVQVIGLCILCVQVEGFVLVMVIIVEQIQVSGFISVLDVFCFMIQNGGEIQSQQFFSGVDFLFGVQQVDLCGFGFNYILVLVNGCCIVDFLMFFQGCSNFIDVFNILIGMIEWIEVLIGSVLVIYGLDVIVGVVNFIFKKWVDGIMVDVCMGMISEGGGELFDMSIVSGFDVGCFSVVYSLELQLQILLWVYECEQQDFILDVLIDSVCVVCCVYLCIDWNDDYLDLGQVICDVLVGQNNGSIYYVECVCYGFYCGSDCLIGYGMILSKCCGVNGYVLLNYVFDNGVSWFVDVQMGYYDIVLMCDVIQWGCMVVDGNEDGYFYNQVIDQVEFWQCQFLFEEMGGLCNGMICSMQKIFSVIIGFKGSLNGVWDYEVLLSYLQYQLLICWLQIVVVKVNVLFFGEQFGEYIDDDDNVFLIFNVDLVCFYCLLSCVEYDLIVVCMIYMLKLCIDIVVLMLINGELFELLGGKVGFVVIVEFGNQFYVFNFDLLVMQYYYYSWKDFDGYGSCNCWVIVVELCLLLYDMFNVSVVGCYDQYCYLGNSIGKVIWSGGIEWCLIDMLLVCGFYGMVFCVLDLYYVYVGLGNDEISNNDYYICQLDQVDDCLDYEEDLICMCEGNCRFDLEISMLWSVGFVWLLVIGLDLLVDWFDIDMCDQVQDMDVGIILCDEVVCCLGGVDLILLICVDVIVWVICISDGCLYGVYVNLINIVCEIICGIDVGLCYCLLMFIGDFIFSGNYIWVKMYDFQQFDGDVVEDQFVVNSGFDILCIKISVSIIWEKDVWLVIVYGLCLGRLFIYDSYDQSFDLDSGDSLWIGVIYCYNVLVQYCFDDYVCLLLLVVNVGNKMLFKDVIYILYLYYDVFWFDIVGCMINLQYIYKFGGMLL